MKRFVTCPLALMTLCALAQLAHGAPITWSSTPYVNTGVQKETMGSEQFDQAGHLVYAENVGGAGTTFDGITFTAHSGSAVPWAHEGFHNTTVVNPVSHPGAWHTSPQTITLGAGGVGETLIVGMDYRVQLLLMDGRNGYSGRYVELDGVNQGVFANGDGGTTTWGDGLLVTGTFTATNTSQAFTLEVFTSGGSPAGAHLNALLLYEDVPDLNDGVVIIGRGIRNGDFNEDADLGDQRTFAQTPTWENMGNADQSDNTTRLQAGKNPDETRHALMSGDSTRVLAQDTGHDIGAGNTFTVRYSWVAKSNWNLANGEVRVTLFVTDDDTIGGTQTVLATLDSGVTAVARHVWQYASGTATINNVKYAGKRLFASIDPKPEAAANVFARLDNFSLSVELADVHLYELGEPGTVSGFPLDSVGSADFDGGGSGTTSSASPSPASTHYMSFNGSALYWMNGTHLSTFPTDDFAVELWARTANTAQEAVLFMTGNGTGRLKFHLTGDKWRASYDSVGWIDGNTATAAANEWTHLAVVRRAGNSTLYVNGLAAGDPITGSPTHNGYGHLATASGGANRFTGDLDNIRLFCFDPNYAEPVAALTRNEDYTPFTLEADYGTDGDETIFADPTLTTPVTRGASTFPSPVYFAINGIAANGSTVWNVIMRADGLLGDGAGTPGGGGAGMRMTNKGFLMRGNGSANNVLDQLTFSLHSATELTSSGAPLALKRVTKVAANNFRVATQAFHDGAGNSVVGNVDGGGSQSRVHYDLSVDSTQIIGTGSGNFRLHAAQFQFEAYPLGTVFRFR